MPAGGGNIMRTNIMVRAGYAALAVSILYSTQAAAQQADVQVDDNVIIVTAERRVANLQDVPLSVQVASGEMLQKAGVATLSDIEQISPSIVVNNVTSNVNAYIR